MSHTSRRTFAQSLAAAAAMMPLSAVASAPVPEPDVARALKELMRATYGKHLDAPELVRMEKDFQEIAPVLERLRSFRLDNGDAPDFL